jgi:hypothetical protein
LYAPKRPVQHFVYTRAMQSKILGRLGLKNAWVQEAVLAALMLAIGFGLMPALIYLAGSTALGRYDGASPARVYDGVYQGLQSGSIASWIVGLGPYGMYLLVRGIVLWWRASAKFA